MQPRASHAVDPDHGAPFGGPPPTGRGRGLRLVVGVEPALLAASQRRHPSSGSEAGRAAACDECGFTPPAPGNAAGALRELPTMWSDALQGAPLLIEPAARLRDELHAVTNRVERLLVAPGSALSSVTIDVPTALAWAASRNVLVDLLRAAAHRLAGVLDAMGPEDWVTSGTVGGGVVTVGQLVLVPLHHSHRDLVATPLAHAVVPLERRRPGLPGATRP